MTASLRRIIRVCIGILLILIGIAGLFLPFIQGIALISAGIIILAPDTRLSRWMIKTFRRSVAWIGRIMRRSRGGMMQRLRRPFRWLASRLRRRKRTVV